MKVKAVLDTESKFEVINEAATFNQVLSVTTDSIHTTFPVMSGEGKMAGVISYSVIRPHLYNTDLTDVLIAGDIMILTEPLTPEDTLDVALRRHMETDLEELPVTAIDDPQRILGLISRRDIISAYHKQMRKRG